MNIVRVTSGGIPVTESPTGLPYNEANNGFGIPVTFGGSGIPLGGVSNDPLAPGAPTIAVVSPIANPPSFDLGLVSGLGSPKDTVVGDVLQLGIDAPTATYESSPLDTSAVASGTSNIVNGTLTYGSHVAYARVKRPGSPNRFSQWRASSSWVQPLIVTSAATANNPENSKLAFALTANAVATWTIVGGADSSKFEISGTTLRWAGDGTKNFEAPDDVGADNNYVVTVQADNGAAQATKTITVTVLDVTESVGVNIAFTDHTFSGAETASYTFTARSLGAATTDRNILVGVSSRSNGATVSSLTIGGVTATLLVGGVSGSHYAAIWGAAVPSGTTGDIVVNWSANPSRCGIGVWKMVGAGSLTPSATLTFNGSLTVPANGWAVGVNTTNGSTNTVWTGLTEAYDEAVESTVWQSGADAQSVGGGSLTVSFTASGATNTNVAYAAWGP